MDEERKTRTLFDDSDDECPDLAEQDPDTLVQSRLKGKSAARLMKLEQTFGKDDRFKLDNAFLEDDEVEENENCREMEKAKQLRLLSMVVGRDISAAHSDKAKKQSNVRPFQRFDPENPDHVAWMQGFKKQKELEVNPPEEEKLDEDKEKVLKEELSKVAVQPSADKPAPVVDDTRYFNINADFAAELRKTLTSGSKNVFRFLKDPEDDDAKEADVIKKKKPKITKFDSDSEEEAKKTSTALPTPVVSEAVPMETSLKESTFVSPFFLTNSDIELSRKVNSFCAFVPADRRMAKWQTARQAFMKVSYGLRKKKLRELEKANGIAVRNGFYAKKNKETASQAEVSAS